MTRLMFRFACAISRSKLTRKCCHSRKSYIQLTPTQFSKEEWAYFPICPQNIYSLEAWGAGGQTLRSVSKSANYAGSVPNRVHWCLIETWHKILHMQGMQWPSYFHSMLCLILHRYTILLLYFYTREKFVMPSPAKRQLALTHKMADVNFTTMHRGQEKK